MKIFYRKTKHTMALVIVLAMLLQMVAPVAEYVYAEVMNGEGGETVTEAVYIPSEMTYFSLVVNGIDLATASQEEIDKLELEQEQEGEFTIKFNVNLEGEYKAGDYFEFELPTAIRDFGGLSGSSKPSGDEPIFKYEPVNGSNKVKVYLTDDLNPDQMNNNVEVKLNFKSKFGFNDDKLEQEIEIPVPGETGGTKAITLTFKPETKDEHMSKESLGVTIENGERYIGWVIWVNKAGKNLNNATITDVPSGTPAHVFEPGSLVVKKYNIGLSGVLEKDGQGNDLGEEISGITKFLDITMNGKYAYKITYKTKVTEETPSGEQIFKNTVTLTSPGFEEETSNGSQKITYGEALEKLLRTDDPNSNYVSNWEIRYNYNLASIPEPVEGEFNIVDTLSGPHNIITNSIKVYKMSTDENGNVIGEGTEINEGYSITETKDSGNNVKGFSLKFDGTVTDAYRITYTAKYDKDFYTDLSSTVINTVTAGENEDSDGYSIGQNVLRKSYTLDLATQELTWTITIKADNADINNLTLEDVFAQEDTATGMGKQRLEGNITITGSTGHTISPNSDPIQGFTITGINIVEGDTATITYKTKYAVGEDGKVAKEYKNTATARWSNDKGQYNVEVSESYKPGTTTTNNGSKSGKYDYSTQKFTWGIKVNFNKKDIKGAVLTDTLGQGHEIIEDSLKIYNFEPKGGTDTGGEKGTEVALTEPGDYGVVYNVDSGGKKVGFTLTFSNSLDENKNNKAYYVEYKTKDSDNIIGLSKAEQDLQTENKGAYTNTATFKTKDTTTHTLESTPVIVKDANHLISKGVQSNNTKETLTWTIDINKSLSDIGDTILTDKPSLNLMLLSDTIEVREMISVNNSSGTITYGSWAKPDPAPTINNEEGSFTLALGDLSKKAVQVRYETLVLGKRYDSYSNNATINYTGSGQKDDGGESDSKKEGSFQFSSSDITSSSARGNVKFKKVGHDEATGNQEILGNVSFQLIKKIGSNEYIIRDAVSDSEGNFEFNSIGYGNYLIREVSAPTGYIKMADEPFTMGIDTDIKLLGNGTKVIELINTKINQGFKLTKVDADDDNAKLSGVVFELYKADETPVTKDAKGNDITGKLTTDDEGVILIDDLPEGDYYLVETTAPEGYWLDKTPIHFTVSGDNVKITELAVKNTKQGDLIIKKVDKADNKPLKDAEFTLYDAKDNVIATAKTDADGIAKFTNIKYGSYKLNESTAPIGYVASGDININIDSPTKQETVTNEKIHQAVKLIKVDSTDANIVLEGAVFTLHKADTHEQVLKKANGEDIGEIKTSMEGEVTLNNLTPGTYYFKEVTAPEYYLLSSEINTEAFTIEPNQTIIKEVTATNTRGKGSIIIKKVDSDDETILLEGVEFKLSGEDSLTVRTGTTGADGTIKFNDLPYDTYTIEEITPHPDYVLNFESIEEIVLDGNTDGEPREITVTNTKKDHSVILIKYDGRDNSIKLQGAIFELRKENEEGEYEVVTEDLATDENGEIHLENLEAGKYQLIETKAPAGYRLDKTPVQFVIDENQTEPTKVEKINYRIPPVDPDPGPGPGPKEPEIPEKPTNPPTEPVKPKEPEKPVEPPTYPEEPTVPEEGPPTVKEETPKDNPKEGEVKVPEGSDQKVKNPPENGTVTIDENGKWVYTPNPGFVGKDRFTIIIKHPDGTEEEILIEIDVDEVPTGAPDVLPKTGEGSHLGYYLTGLLLVLLGIFLRRKIA